MALAVEAARMGWGVCTVLGVAGKGETLDIIPRFLITGRTVIGGSFGGTRGRTNVPELVDIKGETRATQSLYGMDSSVRETREYGRQCLLARRLVERGVRFVELTCLPHAGGKLPGNPWDQHGGLKAGHAEMARQVDQPITSSSTFTPSLTKIWSSGQPTQA